MKNNINFLKLNMYLKSTVDWCETNYNVLPYIAEFWNTISGLCLIFSGILFQLHNKKISKYSNFYRISNLLIFVGFGTMLFHGTLYYPFQLLDELPMLFLSIEYIMLLISLRTTQKCFSKEAIYTFSDIIIYTYWSVLIIIISYFVHPVAQIVSFHFSLKVVEISILILLYKLSKTLNKIVYTEIYDKHHNFQDIYNLNHSNDNIFKSMYNQEYTKKFKSHLSKVTYNINKESKVLQNIQNDIKIYINFRQKLKFNTQMGVYLYSTSVLIWCIENMFCDYVEPFKLHAIWHLLSSIGIYYLNNIMKTHLMIDKFTFGDPN